ncbi:hypothetical protein [Caballeronia sp. GAWG1-5s-s]|uniref:hypothetical protein n=2 Tax=unclassified Caballeronia TaxID=2646786 RepID=UPI0020276F0F|nr:hypothetical protein [Caballeronia sp. GAWG1-5s-s]
MNRHLFGSAIFIVDGFEITGIFRLLSAAQPMLERLQGAPCAWNQETAMKATAAIAGALLALASTASLAQEMTRDQMNQRPQTQQQGQNASPGGANDAAQGGAPSGTSGSGTLMQKREQGMSPDTSQPPARGSKSTGTMKQ